MRLNDFILSVAMIIQFGIYLCVGDVRIAYIFLCLACSVWALLLAFTDNK